MSLREQLRGHPAHRLADREASVRIGERYLRVERDNAQLRQKIAAATNSLARTFDRIVGLLSERGFAVAEGGDVKVTDDGRLLARIYSESDLLVAECLRTGAWRGLAPAELAAVLSSVVYELPGRGRSGPTTAGRADRRSAPRPGRHPPAVGSAAGRPGSRHRIAVSREPDEGFVATAYRWATTGDLASALAAAEAGGAGTALSAGDFVRWCRQLLDLLDQVRLAAPDPGLRGAAKRAIDDVRRGVVAIDIG